MGCKVAKGCSLLKALFISSGWSVCHFRRLAEYEADLEVDVVSFKFPVSFPTKFLTALQQSFFLICRRRKQWREYRQRFSHIINALQNLEDRNVQEIRKAWYTSMSKLFIKILGSYTETICMMGRSAMYVWVRWMATFFDLDHDESFKKVTLETRGSYILAKVWMPATSGSQRFVPR